MDHDISDTPTSVDADVFMIERDSWRTLLEAEDDRCIAEGHEAGVLTIDFGTPVPHRSARLLAVLAGHLDTTDRASFVSPSEIQVMISPVASSTDLERRAGALSASLHEEGLSAGVGWAPRRSSGFLDATARADAAAAARRPRDPVIDMRDV